jgi:hypothetical protein
VKKVLLIAGIVVVVGIGAVVWKVMTSLDSIVKNAIETQGSKATGTQVTVGSVEIGLREGRAAVMGLQVANPGAFVGDAFAMNEIAVDIDVASVRKDPVVIEEVRIVAPEVWFIVAADGKSNIDALRRNLDSSSGGGAESGGGGDTRIRVSRFVFEDGRVHADATAVGAKKPIDIDMPSLVMNDLGGANGATPDVIAKTVMKAYAKRVAEVAAREGLEAAAKEGLMDKAEDAGRNLLDKVVD